MSRLAQFICLTITCSLLSGCSMCCGIFDFQYPVFQGNYSRSDPEYGRVGSIFSDPNVGFGSQALTNSDVPDAEPTSDAPFNLEPENGGDPATPDTTNPDGTSDTDTSLQTERQQRAPRWR